MLTTPGRQVGLAADVGEEQRAEGRRRGGLEDDGVARGEGRGDLPREHQQREVPGDDLGRNAERLRDAAGERVLELVGPAGVVPAGSRGERHVDVTRLLDRLAGVHRLQDREFAPPLLEDPGDPEEVLGSLAAGHVAPGAARAAGPPGRPCPCRLRSPCDQRQRLFRGGVDRDERAAVRRLRDLPTPDEQPVALLDRDDVARLGRGRILPGDRGAVAEPPARRGAAVRAADTARAGARALGLGGHRQHYVTRARGPAQISALPAWARLSSGSAASG